jgi:shikimate kinase
LRSPTLGSSRRWRNSCPRATSLARREPDPNRVKADKIYLVGFMAAGKSTLARALAKRLDWRAVDVDELIESRERQTVADIFAKRGEPYFRTVERHVLFEHLAPRHLVVATGGGTFADVQNRAAINADGVSVWLDVPLDRLIGRVPADGRRPLAADRSGFERLYHQRRAAYELAHVRLDAARASVDALVEQLVDWLEH